MRQLCNLQAYEVEHIYIDLVPFQLVFVKRFFSKCPLTQKSIKSTSKIRENYKNHAINGQLSGHIK